MAASLTPWSKKAAEAAQGPQNVQPQDFLEMVTNLSGSFSGVQESEPWLSPRTEVTRWNPEWYVALAEKPRQLLRFLLWVSAHASRMGVFVLVVFAITTALIVHFTA